MWDPIIRRKAIKLRKQGYTHSEIRSQIPGLPKGTLSGWCDGIVLTKYQERKIFKRANHSLNQARLLAGATLHSQRIEREKSAIENAKKIFFNKKDSTLFLMGVILYWAEGTKNQSFQFMNSDPRLVRLMIRWLIEFSEVPKDLIIVRLYSHKGFEHEKKRKVLEENFKFFT